MTASSGTLARLFDPASIAVVGASASEDKAGFQILKALERFRGTVYPINPRGGEILGNRVFTRLSEVPGPVDLVALVLPARHSIAVIEEAAAIHAGAAFMVSGGFGETDADGAELEAEVCAACRAGGLRLLGPNTSGFLRPARGLACTFLPAAAGIGPGPIGIIAQSGGINLTLAMMAHAEGLGISLAAGLGNAADVGAAEAIGYLAEDSRTRAIVVHLEGVADGRALFDAVAAASAVKPVIALPVGKTDLGGFARSHTGTLMGSHALTRSALIQAGAVVVDGLVDALDAAHALSLARLGPDRRPGIGVLTAQAGPGLLMTDTLNAAGLRVPRLAAATVERIAAHLPPLTYMGNPVDTGRPDESFGAVLRLVAGDAAIDAVLCYALIEDATLDPVAAFAAAREDRAEPMIFGTSGVPERVAAVIGGLRAAGIPALPAPDRAARAMRALAEDARARARAGPPPADGADVPTLGPSPLDEDAAKTLIARCGIPVPRRRTCAGRAEALAAFGSLGKPVVAKVLDPRIIHKTEAGGVHPGIETEDDLVRALDSIEGERYLIEEEAPPGLELIIGGRNDPSFGPTVLLGLGGVAAEAMGDVAIRLAPLGADDVEEMIEGLAGRALFGPWRGAAAPDRTAIVRAVLAVASLIAARPEIAELDLNPVRAYPDGLIALDALVVL